MIRTYEISATRPDPVQPGQKLPVGPTDPRPFGEREFVAAWLGHLAAGRVGGNPPMSDETRAAILANERVLRGR